MEIFIQKYFFYFWKEILKSLIINYFVYFFRTLQSQKIPTRGHAIKEGRTSIPLRSSTFLRWRSSRVSLCLLRQRGTQRPRRTRLHLRQDWPQGQLQVGSPSHRWISIRKIDDQNGKLTDFDGFWPLFLKIPTDEVFSPPLRKIVQV